MARSESKAFVQVVLPLLAYYLAEVFINLTDLHSAGRIGEDAVAAVGLAKSIVFGYLIICAGVLSAVGVFSAGAAGGGRHEELGRFVSHGLWISLGLATIGVFVSVVVPRTFLRSGYEPSVIAEVDGYLLFARYSLFPALAFVVLRNVLMAVMRSSAIIVVTIAGAALNALLNVILVRGYGPIPAMGTRGIGLSTLTVYTLGFVALCVYVRRTPATSGMLVWRDLARIERSTLWEMLKIGLPGGGTKALEGGFFIALTMIMGVLGGAWLAANNIVLALLEVPIVASLSVSEAACVRVAFHAARSDGRMVRGVALATFAAVTLIMGAGLVALVIVPLPILRFFMDSNARESGAVVEAAVLLARIGGVFQVFDGLQIAGNWVLRGLKDTVKPMMLAAVGYWVVGLGTGAVLWLVLRGHGASLWLGTAVGSGVTGILVTARCYWRTQQSPATWSASVT